jgi:hypothetical protein
MNPVNPINYIESLRQFYDTRTIEVPGDDSYSQAELINEINCARLSRYVSDNASDDIIGAFPYDNITKYRIRLEARATDFDTSHITIDPLNGSRKARVSAMIVTKALQKYMRKIKFGNTLNKITDTLPEYGGVLVKKTKEGVHVVPWENVVTDMSDIMGGAIIERHYYLPSQLKKMGWDNVDDVIATAAVKKKKVDMQDEDAENTETMTELIEIWEVHGEVQKIMYDYAEAMFEGNEYEYNPEDETEFVSCQIILAPQGKNDDGDMQGVFLQVNEEGPLSDTYRYKARNPHSSRGLGQGIVEELGEHQRWHNFYKTEEARAVAIGGKVMFVTDDGNVVDTIYDDGIDHGTILKVGENKMFQQANTLPNSVPIYGNIRAEYSDTADKLTNSFAVALGSQEFSDTPFKAQYLQDINSNSQFKQYYEEISEELVVPIINDWLLDEALADAVKDQEIYETFSRQELNLIDEVIVEANLTEQVVEASLNQQVLDPAMVEQMRTSMQNQLNKSGTKRQVKEIKEFVKKDAIGQVVVHVSDEQKNKRALFESFSTAMTLFAENDPARLAIRDRILDQMGVSKEELSLYVEEAAAMAGQPPLGNTNPQVDAEALTETDKEAMIA